MGRRGRARGAALVAAVALAISPPGPRSPAPAEAAPEDPLKVVVVLDVSGSMARPGGNGLTLLGGARRAIAELTAALPAGAHVGLRVYGSRYAGTDRTLSCRDTRLLVPVGPGNGAAVVQATSRLRPTGDTPIGLALKSAAGDLDSGPAAERVIVLVSDGEDNCSPPDVPPCQVVQGLRRGGVNVRIESVGVALQGEPAAQRALRCVARRSGGSYYDAADADALSAALERISSETLGALGAGRRIGGGRTFDRARRITPGAYRTTLTPGGQAWFRFRTRPGDVPRVLGTVRGLRTLRVPPESRGCPAWRIQLYNPYEEGGTYPPYGNSGAFDGVGLGTTGASTSGPVRRYSHGIDYSGLWTLRLSLAADTLDTCSATLPARRYDARFTLDLGGGRPDRGDPREEERPTPTPGPDPTPAPTPDPDEPSAAAKYDTPVDPDSTPGWVYPVVAVGSVLALGSAVVALRVWLRRRQQGW